MPVDVPKILMAKIVIHLLTKPDGILFSELSGKYGLDDKNRRNYITSLKDLTELFDDNGATRVTVDGRGDERRLYLRHFDPEKLKDDSTGNILSIYFALAMLRFLKGTKLEDHIRKTFEALYRNRDGKELLLNLEKKVYSINEWPKDYADKKDILKDCLHSLIHRKKLIVHYRKAESEEEAMHKLDIYTLVQYRNGLYLIAKSNIRKDLRVLALERIIRCERTGEGFHVPRDYTPERYIDGAFGLIHSDESYDIAVDFSADVRHLVMARKWHKTARFEDRKSGEIRLRMTVSSLTQVVPWVLSFGKHAKVIEPPELKKSVYEEISAMAKHYRPKTKTTAFRKTK